MTVRVKVPLQFEHAVANWRRWVLEREETTGFRDMCGSAERFYAFHPERKGNELKDEIEVPINHGLAVRFQGLLKNLTPPERMAWNARNGVGPQPEGGDVERPYITARARLALLWIEEWQ